MQNHLTIVILAAGQSKRMKSDISKVLHPLAGISLLERVVKTALALAPQKIFVVYGNHGQQLPETMTQLPVEWIKQEEQLGTGHAVSQALPNISDDQQVLILYGDVPLISVPTLQQLLKTVNPNGLGIVTTVRQNPYGYGRIRRDTNQKILAIVEQKDATPEQQQIKEINTGILVAPAKLLRTWLPQLKNQNTQHEFYLTDIIGLAAQQNYPITAVVTASEEETQGVNDRAELAKLERYYQWQQAQQLMAQGVTLIDPHRFDARGTLTIAQDVTIDINAVFEGNIVIGPHTTIGPNVLLRNVTIGANVQIKANCVIEDSIIKDNCTIGPFARLRPETEVDDHVHIGNFVEIKKSKIGVGSKVPHLSYVGDASIGKDVNIGAGVITCNYDGVSKNLTIIKDGAFIGSDSQLVAPVTVGENAYIGSGSTITKNAPPEQLTLARARQTTISNWKRPQKPKNNK